MVIPLVKNVLWNEKETRGKLSQWLLEDNQLTIGDECRSAEMKIAKLIGVNRCTLFNSGSSANLALFRAMKNTGKLKEGAVILVSGVTWATNVMPLIEMGFRPVPVDVSLETLNVTKESIEQALKKYEPQALFITHLLGQCSDMSAIKEMCDRTIYVLEDACEAFGIMENKQMAGSIGYAGTFSFYASHQFSTIEGGAVCTDDWQLDNELRMVRNHGMDRHVVSGELVPIQKDWFRSQFQFYTLGYNLRPTEIVGKLINLQLADLDKIMVARFLNGRRLMKIVREKFQDEIYPLKGDFSFSIPIVFKKQDAFEKTKDAFKNAKIEIRPIVGGNITRQPFWQRWHLGSFDLPNADIIDTQGLYFGNHPNYTEEELIYVENIIKSL